MIFLDNFAMTKPSSRVRETEERLLKQYNTPYNAPYASADPILKEVQESLSAIYELVGAEKEDIFHFVSSEEEAARRVFGDALIPHMYESGKNLIMILETAGASLSKASERLKAIGCEEQILPVNENGQLTVEILEKNLSPRSGILAISWVEPLTGVIQPVWEIADFCKKNGILLYVEASEIFAKLFFNFRDIDIDFLSFQGDRFHGPKGSGGLFVKKRSKAAFFLKKEPIHPTHIPALVALGVAAIEVMDYMDTMCTEVARLRMQLEEGLKKEIPGIEFFCNQASRVPNVSAFAIRGIHAEYLLFHMTNQGVAATFGGGLRQKLSYILEANEVDPYLAKCAISIALSSQTTVEEVEKTIKIIAKIAHTIQQKGVIYER